MTVTKTKRARDRAERIAARLAESCANKTPLHSLAQAEQRARSHGLCDRCLSTSVFGAYRCRANPDHYHLGHRYWWSADWIEAPAP